MNHREEVCIPLAPVYMSNTRATHDLQRINIAPRRRVNRRTEKRKMPVRWTTRGTTRIKIFRGEERAKKEKEREREIREALLTIGSFV